MSPTLYLPFVAFDDTIALLLLHANLKDILQMTRKPLQETVNYEVSFFVDLVDSVDNLVEFIFELRYRRLCSPLLVRVVLS